MRSVEVRATPLPGGGARLVPREGHPGREFQIGAEWVRVDLTSYYRRRIARGELEVREPAPPAAPASGAARKGGKR